MAIGNWHLYSSDGIEAIIRQARPPNTVGAGKRVKTCRAINGTERNGEDAVLRQRNPERHNYDRT